MNGNASVDPLVSIIVPCYNGEKYLDECLRSLLSQTYFALEIVVSDDGSTDHSVAIAQTHAANDSRIKVLAWPTRIGMTANWNRGLQHCTGTYIAKLDCDDTMQPNTIAELISPFHDDTNLVASFCRATVCDEQLRPIGEFSDHYWRAQNIDPLQLHRFDTQAVRKIAYGWTPLWNSSSFLMLRSRLVALNGWDESFSCAADVDLFLRLLQAPGFVEHRPLAGVNYRVVDNSVSRAATADNWLILELSLVHLKNFVQWRRSGRPIPSGLARYMRGLRLRFADEKPFNVTRKINVREKLSIVLSHIPTPDFRESIELSLWKLKNRFQLWLAGARQ